MTKLAEIQSAIMQLPLRDRTELRDWLMERVPPGIDPERDSPEVEAELIKVAEGPFTLYSSDEMRTICERVVHEFRQK